eukprot:1183369-Prorocentrum_minimum.AAC.1
MPPLKAVIAAIVAASSVPLIVRKLQKLSQKSEDTEGASKKRGVAKPFVIDSAKAETEMQVQVWPADRAGDASVTTPKTGLDPPPIPNEVQRLLANYTRLVAGKSGQKPTERVAGASSDPGSELPALKAIAATRRWCNATPGSCNDASQRVTLSTAQRLRFPHGLVLASSTNTSHEEDFTAGLRGYASCWGVYPTRWKL